MQVSVEKSILHGNFLIPPSKSHTIRAILFASLAEGKSTINNFLPSPDTKAMIEACRAFGAKVEKKEKKLFVTGVGGKVKRIDDVIDAKNSGLVLRFIAAISSLIPSYTVITGDHSIRFNRPILPLLQGLEQLGCFCISTKKDGYAPVVIKGPIQAGKIVVEGSDSQIVSALLIVASFIEKVTEIEVINPKEQAWIDVTLYWLKKQSIECIHRDYHYYRIQGNKRQKGFTYTVPADFSSLAFPLIAAIVTQSTISIDGLSFDDVQGDKKIVDLLISMGAKVQKKGSSLHAFPSKDIEGGEVDANEFIDAVPILAVLGCSTKKGLQIKNASIARTKESDRLAAITKELRKMGAKIEEKEDELFIFPSSLTGSKVFSHKDHRIAMSLYVAGLMAEGKTTIDAFSCVEKSYPFFYNEMQKNIVCT